MSRYDENELFQCCARAGPRRLGDTKFVSCVIGRLGVDDDEERLLRRPERLALPFGAIGAVGGWAAVDIYNAAGWISASCAGWLRFHEFPRVGERLSFALMAGVALLVVGRICAHRLKFGEPVLAAAPFLGFIAAGASGIVLGIAENRGEALAEGVLLGIVAIPFCFGAGYAGSVAWAARRGTIAHRVARRATWLFPVSLAAFASMRQARGAYDRWVRLEAPMTGEVDPFVVAVALALTLALVLCALTARDYLALLEMRRQDWEPSPPRGPCEVEPLDLGLGSDEAHQIAPAAQPYRDRDRVVARLRGDFRPVYSAVGAALVLAIVVGVVSAIGISVPTWTICAPERHSPSASMPW